MEIIQRYFECVRDSGVDLVFDLTRMRGNEKVETYSFDHCFYDGVSAMTEVARKFPEVGFKAPAIMLKPEPRLPKKIWELIKWYVRFYPFLAPHWKKGSNTGRPSIASAVLEIKDWKRSSSSSSINALLLLALDKASQVHITKQKAPRIWMTPVGLYDKIDRNILPANRVSFIDLKVKDNTLVSDLKKQIRDQLMDLNYWGTFLTMYPLVIVGKRLYTHFARNLHHIFRRTGTFSNVGEWQIPGMGPDEWLCCSKGCVAKFSPVEATAIVINGHLSLSIHFHESLNWTHDDARLFIEKWKDYFLNLKED